MLWNTQTYTGWGRVLSAEGDLARPERAPALAALSAHPAIGARRSYGDACLNSEGPAVDMTRLDRILRFDAATGVVEAEAGVPVGELARLFAPLGWMPTVLPGTGFATVGGCIAMDVHGKNHHADGSFGCHVIALKLMVAGKPKTISPKRNAKLFKATIGGLGQTGMIASATLQMTRCEGVGMEVTEQRAESWDEHIALLSASKARYAVGWLDCTAKGKNLGRGIVEEARSTGVRPQSAPKGAAKSVPFNFPRFTLSKAMVSGFNKAYYLRIRDGGQTRIKPLEDFFFPLDKIHNWNRLYGKSGFHQFQCVLPDERLPELRAMVEMIATSGLASPLAVLKRLGADTAGLMSFPMQGYTLAVDFRDSDEARKLIKRLNGATLAAGGRIYFAKDSLTTEAEAKAMYPDWATWADEVNKADPEHQFATDLTRRLGLRSA
ncbi:FAD-binding protein [Lentibacter sp.]|uniref:FAD-binding oxidoreductase n=1 Tax=Lentibacter sp. TaxID=2024994 RepID=UPI003F69A2F1